MVLTNGEVVDPPTVAPGFADLDLAARPGAGPDVVDAGQTSQPRWLTSLFRPAL
jgi:hypothetical protein